MRGALAAQPLGCEAADGWAESCQCSACVGYDGGTTPGSPHRRAQAHDGARSGVVPLQGTVSVTRQGGTYGVAHDHDGDAHIRPDPWVPRIMSSA